MNNIFPEPILNLPQADIPIQGCTAWLSQSEDHQILFMSFKEDVELPEHSHEAQWGIVLEGRIDLVIDGIRLIFNKGDRYLIPSGVLHSGKIHAGYHDITYFNQNNRYQSK